MSYPALYDFERDPDVTPSVERVYRHLRTQELVHYEPRRVKLAAVADAIRMQPSRAGQALRWLTTHGYVIDKGRDGKLYTLVLAYRRETARAAV